ncbi:MAG: putative porin, partial [Opitutaceae bacterium]
HELAFNGKLDYNHFEPFQASFWGEFEQNLVFHKKEIALDAVNNLGGTGRFAGGDQAWIVGVTVGKVALQKRWDWNVGLNYRHVESDSVVDGFDDADFGGVATGTNLKGYTLSGALALSSRVWLGIRWMSSSQIAGPVLKTDVLQIDINSKF